MNFLIFQIWKIVKKKQVDIFAFLCIDYREREVREKNLYKYKQTSIPICIENHISSAQAAPNFGESDPKYQHYLW